MKNKLTLSVSEQVIRKARRYSKQTGKSLSRMFEELFEAEGQSPLKTASQHAAERLLRQLEKSKSVRTGNDKVLLKKHLITKYA